MTLRDFSEWAYEQLVSDYYLIQDRLSLSQKISAIEAIYSYGWLFPFGRYADERLETELRRIFQCTNLETIVLQKPVPGKIVHIVSTLTGYGGHSRILYNWIKNDKVRKHSIIITRQNETMPAWIKEGLDEVCEDIIIIKEKDPIQKVREILEQIQNGYEAVILHHHPDDTIPVLAAFHPAFPPVAIYNHADHLMWPGVSVADIIINIRKTAEWYSREYRGISRSFFLPFILKNKYDGKEYLKQDAKEKLGIEKYLHVGITIASAYKLKPIKGENFYLMLNGFLINNANVFFYLIGPSEEDWKKYTKIPIPKNLAITGIVEQPNLYLSAADFYLQTFPLAGGLATFDACSFEMVPVFYSHAPKIENIKEMIDYSEYLPVGREMVEYDQTNFIALRDILKNEDLYRQYLTAVKKLFNENSTDVIWSKYMNDFYMTIGSVKHKVYPMDICKVERTEDASHINEALARSIRNVIYYLLHNEKYSWMNQKTCNTLKNKRLWYFWKDLIRFKFNRAGLT